MRQRRFVVVLTCVSALMFGSWLVSSAYDSYTAVEGSTNSNCGACHGDFRASSYTSLVDGQNWGNLHNLHRQDMLGGECDACHSGGSRWPVLLSLSDGTTSGELLSSCSGCHGRSQDGTGIGRVGWGAGLRQHHFRAGVTDCAECHERSDLGGLTDANPLYFIPAGENVAPPSYGVLASMPDNPCNSGGTTNENFAGATIGLDNDGDGFHDPTYHNWDGSDANCGATPTPGEASRNSAKAGQGLPPLTATKSGGMIQLSYGAACSATGHRIAYGPLSQVSVYGYSGQECGIGTTGSFSWADPPGDLFFLVVADDGSSEGGYGFNSGLDVDGDGTVEGERPEDTTSTDCPLAQDLTSRCDNP